ncbi:MAG: UvrD-helicase domain-containing protein [Ignavibacteria bacterium]
MSGKLQICTASAGSGKTSKLAAIYIKLALRHPDAFKSILAVTFTNKATQEMKERIIRFLYSLSDIPENNHEINSLLHQLENSGIQNRLKELSSTVLKNILHNYSHFSVSTIDSFFTRILHSFAREMGISYGYQIELEQRKVLDEVIERLLDKLQKGMELTDFLIDYLNYKIDNSGGWNIERDLKNLSRELLNETYWEKRFSRISGDKFIEKQKESVRRFTQELREYKRAFVHKVQAIASKINTIFENNQLSENHFYNRSRGLAPYLKSLANATVDDFKLPTNSQKDAIEDLETKFFTKKTPIDNKVKEELKALLFDLKRLFYEQKEGEIYKSIEIILQNIFLVEIFKDILEELISYRVDNKILLQADINLILRKIISTDTSPFILERAALRYKHFLFDEFQDTSLFQWHNFKPLIENSLSENHETLIVGDVKQAIYRWRNGDMKLLAGGIFNDLRAFSSNMEIINLKNNHRSCQNIVSFNNLFFSKLPEFLEFKSELLTKTYSSNLVNQNLPEDKPGGYVNVRFISEPNEATENYSIKEKLEENLLQVIDEVLNDGYDLKDIVILVRRNIIGNGIAELLVKNGKQVTSSDSLLVYKSSKVKLIIGVLKLLCDEKNKLMRFEVLYEYLLNTKGLFDISLYELLEDSESLAQQLKAKLPPEFFSNSKEFSLNPLLSSLSLYEVCELIIQIFKLDSADPYILKFLETVDKYMKNYEGDIVSFLMWWDDNKKDISIAFPEEANAIRIMTIHSAKGLSGRVIVIPYTDWELGLDGTKDYIWVSSDNEPVGKYAPYCVKAVKGLETTLFKNDYLAEQELKHLDNINLLYVAFTRAVERLYVFVESKKNSSKSTNKTTTKANNLPLLIESVVKNLGLASYDNPAGFEFGDKNIGPKRIQKKISKSPDLQYHNLDKFISLNYFNRIVTKPYREDLQIFFNDERRQLIERGIVLHKILSKLRYRDELDRLLANVLVEETDISDIAVLKQSISYLVYNSPLEVYFSRDWKVLNESEIITPEIETLRPDRIVFKDDTAVVIDYKTGSQRQEDVAQINRYGAMLSKMGYKIVKKYLVYFELENGNLPIKIIEL